MRVALVGNPNCGKTTLFNALTGANQYVGNWPGVTVEKKSGKLKADKSIEITDLPGIYSLSPYTLEEVIARDFLIKEHPDAILNIVDGTNLERNLYLSTQLLEMGIPVVVAVNMMDVVRKRGDQINITALEEKLSCPVVEISALKNEGIDQVVNCLKTIPSTVGIEAMAYSREVEDALTEIIERFEGSLEYSLKDLKREEEGAIDQVPEHLQRFYAIKLLENDEKIRESLKNPPDVSDIIARIENQNDRRMTVMTTTFIPCGAKLPIIALFAAAVFGGVWWVAPSAYFLGIAAILCTGIILKKTRFFAGDPAPFIMELPAYHMPTVGAVLRSMWERAWSFIKKAGTIILLACILVWFISTYGVVDGTFMAVEDQNDSILAVLGTLISWIFNPLGWGDWQAASAAVTGLIAKENVVGTLGILYNGDAGWYANVQAAFTPLVAYSFLAFNLLCAPCFAAMGAIKREMNNRKWFWAAIGYQCGLAWVVALWIYQIGGMITGEVAFGPFTVIAILLAIAFIYLLFRKNKYKGKVESLTSVAAES